MNQPTEAPTKAQKNWFWEQCGFTILGGHWWSGYKWDEEKYYVEKCSPPIDLNNLWKYAIPQLCKEYRNWHSLLHDWVDQCTGDYEKDTLLLFAQTYDAMKEKLGED